SILDRRANAPREGVRKMLERPARPIRLDRREKTSERDQSQPAPDLAQVTRRTRTLALAQTLAPACGELVKVVARPGAERGVRIAPRLAEVGEEIAAARPQGWRSVESQGQLRQSSRLRQ